MDIILGNTIQEQNEKFKNRMYHNLLNIIFVTNIQVAVIIIVIIIIIIIFIIIVIVTANISDRDMRTCI